MRNREFGKRFDVSDDVFESCVREMEIPDGENVLVFKHIDNIDNWISKNFAR